MPQINYKNHPNKIMTKTFKTIIASILLLLITSLVSFSEIKAEEVKKDQQAAKPKISNQEKAKYSKQQKDAVIQKIQNKQNLSLEEQKIRIEILKEQYPMDWYDDMFKFRSINSEVESNFGSCETYINETLKCNPFKIVEYLTTQQIKSLILHADDDKYGHFMTDEGFAIDNRVQSMVGIILKITDELNKDNLKSVKMGEKLIIKDEDDNLILMEISKKDIGSRYINIYNAFSKKDDYCGSYVTEEYIDGNQCLPFSLGEIRILEKKNLILQVFKEWKSR